MSDAEDAGTYSGEEDSPLAELKRKQNEEKKDLRGKDFYEIDYN